MFTLGIDFDTDVDSFPVSSADESKPWELRLWF